MNELEKMAKYNKKHSKGLGWFVKLDAGNVEHNIEMFNKGFGPQTTSAGSNNDVSSGEATGMGESIDVDAISTADLIKNDGILVYNNVEYQMPDKLDELIQDIIVEETINYLDKYSKKDYSPTEITQEIFNNVLSFIVMYYIKPERLVVTNNHNFSVYLANLATRVINEAVDAYNEEMKVFD